MRRYQCIIGLVLVILVFGFISTNSAFGKPYYEGKVITFLVPTSAGGGTDFWARMIARYIRKYIPGKPGVVVRNKPGGSHLIGMNYAWASKPDGKLCLVTSATGFNLNALRPKGVKFWLEKMHPIYSSPFGNVTFAKPGLIKEPKDIMTAKGLVFGQDAPMGASSAPFVWAKELLRFETKKMVFGYAGTGPAWLAFLSGEINVSATSTVGYFGTQKAYEKNGELMPIFQSGILDNDGNLVRDPGAPDVPTPLELYKQIYGKDPSGKVWEVYKMVVAGRTYGKAVLLHKDTPKGLIDILRKAVKDMVKDPKFLKEAEKMNPGAPHFVGDELVSGYRAGVKTNPEVVQFMKKVYTEKYGVVFD